MKYVAQQDARGCGPATRGPHCRLQHLTFCEVRVGESAPINHFVVMLGDGTVLDPLAIGLHSLGEYHEVHNVVGVYSLADISPDCPPSGRSCWR